MSDPTPMPTFALKAADGPDPFTPRASPSHAFWGLLVTQLREIVNPGSTPETVGPEPIYERPCPVGLLQGHLGVIHYPSHRLLLSVSLRPIKDSALREDGRCEVGLVVRFDDSALAIPNLVFQVPALPTGIPDITVSIRGRANGNGPIVEESGLYTRAFTGEDRFPDLVRFILARAHAHREACQTAANMVQLDLGPNAAPIEEQIRGVTEAANRRAAPSEALAPLSPKEPEPRDPEARDWRFGTARRDTSPRPAVSLDLGGDEIPDETPVEPLFPDFDPGPPEARTEITLYDLDTIRRELAVAAPPECGERQGPSQTKMLDRLHKLGPDAARRWLEHANAAMLAGIAAIGELAPHFADVTDFVLVHARASINTGTPMRLPPLLIVDEPGTGKTWYLSRLARALGLPFTTLSMAAITTGDTIQGNHPSWRNSAQGVVSKLLLAEPIANPFIFIDEFDKPTGSHGVQGSPYRPYFSALEPANAEGFVDEFLGIPINSAHILWVMAANDIEPLPGPIRSRVTQVKLQPMTMENRLAVAHSIYAEANARLKSWYDPEISPAALRVLEAATPRRMRKAIDGALVRAGADNRRTLTADDVARALAQADAEGATKTFGFVQPHRSERTA